LIIQGKDSKKKNLLNGRLMSTLLVNAINSVWAAAELFLCYENSHWSGLTLLPLAAVVIGGTITIYAFS